MRGTSDLPDMKAGFGGAAVRNLANWLLLMPAPLYRDVQHAVLPARTIYVIMMAGYKSDLVERS